MKVFCINNDGGGFCDTIELEQGTTVEQVFQRQIKHGTSRDYLIRVNRQPVAAGQVLQEGDRISITPVKIHGAIHAAIHFANLAAIHGANLAA